MARAGIWCLAYLDDLLIVAATKEKCIQHTQLAIQILSRLGLVINDNKSRLDPAQVFTWLGIEWNLSSHTAKVSEDKITSLRISLDMILRSQTYTKRAIMQVQGLVNYIGQCDPVIRLMMAITRTILRHFKAAPPDSQIRIPIHLKLRLCKWINIQTVPQCLGSPAPMLIIQTDASLRGWGFQVGQQRFHGVFDTSVNLSINTLELLTIWFALLTVHTKDLVIQILCDNTAAIAALRRGSSPRFRLCSSGTSMEKIKKVQLEPQFLT